MARKKGTRIGEAGRKQASKQGILDDRYTNPWEGVRAKQERAWKKK